MAALCLGQVFLVEGYGRWVGLGFVTPLLLGGATSLALEMASLSFPKLAGSGIGLGLAFIVVGPLSWAYGARGKHPTQPTQPTPTPPHNPPHIPHRTHALEVASQV